MGWLRIRNPQFHWSIKVFENAWISSTGVTQRVVYETPIPSVEDLIARISVATEKIRNMPEIFQNVKNSMQRHCQACQTASGRHFKHQLWYKFSIE
ncbi:hypothetical protein TNCV_1347111 [Trichonephila clavipes]|nr:hypothetical protein TNCV_1347111 [Trichonephila clavipes]